MTGESGAGRSGTAQTLRGRTERRHAAPGGTARAAARRGALWTRALAHLTAIPTACHRRHPRPGGGWAWRSLGWRCGAAQNGAWFAGLPALRCNTVTLPSPLLAPAESPPQPRRQRASPPLPRAIASRGQRHLAPLGHPPWPREALPGAGPCSCFGPEADGGGPGECYGAGRAERRRAPAEGAARARGVRVVLRAGLHQGLRGGADGAAEANDRARRQAAGGDLYRDVGTHTRRDGGWCDNVFFCRVLYA